MPVDYASTPLRPSNSFCGVLSLAMAALTVAWLAYVEFCRPRYHEGGPFWHALWSNVLWPGGIGMALAVVGLLQPSRKRVPRIVAIVIIVVAYVVLAPPYNFA